MKKTLSVVVDKDAFDKIIENAWTDMGETGMKGRIRMGRYLYAKLQYISLEPLRSNILWLEGGGCWWWKVVVDGDGGWLCVNPF